MLMPDARQTVTILGTISRLIDHQQFGAIAAEDGQEYVFAASALRDVQFATLAPGVRVSFEPVSSGKGLRANHVRLLR
jgi:cold shock CspA family protein